MAGIIFTLAALFLMGGLLLWCFSLTLSQEEAEAELEEYIRRRLSHPEGD